MIFNFESRPVRGSAAIFPHDDAPWIVPRSRLHAHWYRGADGRLVCRWLPPGSDCPHR